MKKFLNLFSGIFLLSTMTPICTSAFTDTTSITINVNKSNPVQDIVNKIKGDDDYIIYYTEPIFLTTLGPWNHPLIKAIKTSILNINKPLLTVKDLTTLTFTAKTPLYLYSNVVVTVICTVENDVASKLITVDNGD